MSVGKELALAVCIYPVLKSVDRDKLAVLHSICKYCKFGNFCENFIFMKSVKIHIYGVKNSLLGHDLPISVNNRVISPFC